jgi:hypothetical protein
MTERNPFDQKPEGPTGGHVIRCEEWEALLVDALDGLLPAKEGAAFETHGSDCAACARLLAEARQGREWMQFLHTEPEIPSDMVDRVLHRTSGMAAGGPLAVAGAPLPVATPNVLGVQLRRVMWDRRLMMTAAMAFFSLALTLNLAGVHLNNLRLADLTPSSLQTNLTRQFYGAKIQVVRYYDNLRFVYEVESKMRELRRDEQTDRPPAQPQQNQVNPPNNPTPSNPAGNGHKNGGRLEQQPRMPEPDVIWGHPLLAGTTSTGETQETGSIANKTRGAEREEVDTLVVAKEDQAERSLA